MCVTQKSNLGIGHGICTGYTVGLITVYSVIKHFLLQISTSQLHINIQEKPWHCLNLEFKFLSIFMCILVMGMV